MPKGRRRLTTKKKSTQAPVPLGREKNAPTAQQWLEMPQYRTFEVSDEEDRSYDFSIGDFARVLPNGREVGDPDMKTHEYWICKIVDVRARNEHDVWVLVEWFYSASDATQIDKQFDTSHCGTYERLKSDHTDCVSSSCFDGLTPVKHYDETNLNQQPIGGEEFYYRYTVNMENKSISPTPSASCKCGCLYNPSDTAPNSVMHLCPRPSCQKYYHRGCAASTNTAVPQERIDFLLDDPDTGASLRLPLTESASAEPPAKKRRRGSGNAAILTPTPDPMIVGGLLAALPAALVRAAAQPIVRGGVFGVVGNSAAVLAARRVVFDALQEGTVAEGWETKMPKGWEAIMPAGWDTEELALGGVVQAARKHGVPQLEPVISVSAGRNKSAKGAKGKGKMKAKAKPTVLLCPGCGEAI
ncbi:hypothetical protein K438DRAFT_1836500 [Mycena galopus ATCC 62051]|nr:hypothetical protein K438DRAFT_1836500 [Mycena galopus ATCC 62051]